ncbi:amidase [Horticoccus sp. 23ND18S-11]|uniref:amidase n=1 Tax=Horticoccus sp. 23ND18S-11 TaxID=3391832 RepID=UPI0039C920E0
MTSSSVLRNHSETGPHRRRFSFGARPLLLGAILLSQTAALRASSAPAAFPIEEATIADIHRAIESKQLTAVALVKRYLARIKAYNGHAVEMPEGILGKVKTIPHAGQINALSTLNLRPATRRAWGFDDTKARSLTDAVDADPKMPDALEVAAELDRTFAATGKLVGPLHGVVMAIKDQYDTFDLRTTAGADVAYANDRPPVDADFVTRLRAAGAIILAKSNLGEYASGIPRSSFGGVFVNPYDTERSPMGSSSGSGSAVAANLVTCAIGEETGTSIRGPASYNNLVGIAGTQELVSRHGMIGAGTNTRTGPICRTVEDAARILTVIAGYDPKDEMTAFSLGRLPEQPYETFAREKSLKGLRIGVVREYMDKSKFTKADEENIDIVDRAIADLRKLGADVVEPGPEGLFTPYIRRYYPQVQNAYYTRKYPQQFPLNAAGKAAADHVSTLVAMSLDPAQVPEMLTIRDLGQARAEGESKFMLLRYLKLRGDANVQSISDLMTKAKFFDDVRFGSRRSSLESNEKSQVLDTAVRMQRRFAVQQIVLACMAELKLDAVVYPTNNLPPPKLGTPPEPNVNGRNAVWSFLGGQGFPTITVPAGFTTQVYDRVEDATQPLPPAPAEGEYVASSWRVGSRLVGPVAARLPVGLDVLARPFGEPVMLRIASAYEAATHHRSPPPDFGPLKGNGMAGQ